MFNENKRDFKKPVIFSLAIIAYVLLLIGYSSAAPSAMFDFDGDGKTNPAVFGQSNDGFRTITKRSSHSHPVASSRFRD